MPNNWKTYKLGDVVDLKQGLAINKKTDHLLCEKNSDSIPLFKIRDLLNGTVEHYVKASEVPKQCIAAKDDLIYSRTGQVGHIFKGKTGCVHNNCFKVIPNERLDRGFLYQFLNNPVIRQYANDIASGSVQKDLNHTAFKSIEITLPPLPEQRAIASILSALDDKIELNLQQNKTLEEMAMALYKHWFVDFGPFQNGEFVDSELGKIPKGWEVKRLERLVTKLGDGLHGTPKYTIDGEYFFVNGNNLSNGRIHIKEDTKRVSKEEYNKHKRELNNRTLFVSINGTIGNIAVYGGEKIILGKSACYFNIKEDISLGYIKQVISSKYFMNYIETTFTGSVIKNVSLKSMRDFPIVVPLKKEQQNFQNIIDPMVSKQDELYTENQTLTTLRDTLLPKLISGEVRVKDIEKSIAEVL